MAKFAWSFQMLRVVALIALCGSAMASAIAGAQEGTTQLRVVNIAPNDVLNVREYPTSGSRIIGMIPPDGRGILYLGESVGAWIFVRYDQVQGWVHSRYVAPERGWISRGRKLD